MGNLTKGVIDHAYPIFGKLDEVSSAGSGAGLDRSKSDSYHSGVEGIIILQSSLSQ